MIQRIQSLFLLGVAIISIVLFFVPLSEAVVTLVNTVGDGGPVKFTLNLMGRSINDAPVGTIDLSGYVLILMDLLILVLSIYTIFLYKNRSGQIRLCMLGSLLATIFLVLIFYYSENLGDDSGHPHYLAGVYLVALQVFLLLGARRFIRKDEMLVRAADRIR